MTALGNHPSSRRLLINALWLLANIVLPMLCAPAVDSIGARTFGTVMSLSMLANIYACWQCTDLGLTTKLRIHGTRCALLLLGGVPLSGCIIIPMPTPMGFPVVRLPVETWLPQDEWWKKKNKPGEEKREPEPAPDNGLPEED